MEHDGPPALELQRLALRLPGRHPALAGVDLALKPGERVAMLGPNGAGQDDARARRVRRARRPRPGRVTIGGIGRRRDRNELRRRVGIVFQDPDDQLFMPTVEADVAFGPANQGLRGDALRERVDEALEAVRVHRARRPARRTR